MALLIPAVENASITSTQRKFSFLPLVLHPFPFTQNKIRLHSFRIIIANAKAKFGIIGCSQGFLYAFQSIMAAITPTRPDPIRLRGIATSSNTTSMCFAGSIFSLSIQYFTAFPLRFIKVVGQIQTNVLPFHRTSAIKASRSGLNPPCFVTKPSPHQNQCYGVYAHIHLPTFPKPTIKNFMGCKVQICRICFQIIKNPASAGFLKFFEEERCESEIIPLKENPYASGGLKKGLFLSKQSFFCRGSRRSRFCSWSRQRQVQHL
jgi:hypothetical protein